MGRKILARWSSICEGPKAGKHLGMLRDIKKADVATVSGTRSKGLKVELGWLRPRVCRSSKMMDKCLHFVTPETSGKPLKIIYLLKGTSGWRLDCREVVAADRTWEFLFEGDSGHLQVNSRLLVVQFSRSQKLHADFQLCSGRLP